MTKKTQKSGRPVGSSKSVYKIRSVTDDERRKWAPICNEELKNGYMFIGEDKFSPNETFWRFQRV